ncbi:restriction endonuclease subunit S [Thiolapillus sp.]|uniref:restriction endonuclease subunit S n=3 Tax=Thiolapillus sp. TaxID=2017437 RepID=UPI0025E2AF25|nr:restriction endonuclease subunit S [Thiolapillus sp.]
MGGEAFHENVDIVMGQSPAGSSCNTSGEGLPLLNGPTEFGPNHPRPVQFTTEARKQAHIGDILFCVRGSTGRMNWADQEYAIGRGIAAIRHKSSPELQPLVRAVIKYNLPDLLAQATGSTFPNVSSSQLAQLWWPPLVFSEQRAIAHILGTLDDKIELNRQMAQTLESIARAIFKSWFVDFDPVVVNALRAGNSIPDKFTKRAARYRDNPDELSLSEEIQCQFPDHFQDSELGPIPERWEIGPLKQIASLSTKTIQPKNDPLKLWVHYSIPAYDDGKMPKTEQGQTIMSGKYLVPKHAVLASKLNPQFPRVWLPMQDGIEDSICSTEFMPFIPRDSDERNLLYMFFLSDVAQREITNRVTGSTGSRQRVRPKDIEQMNILIPEKRLRIIYSDLTNGLIGLSLEKQDESATLANIRDTLLPKLISGELRIKDSERFLGKVA